MKFLLLFRKLITVNLKFDFGTDLIIGIYFLIWGVDNYRPCIKISLRIMDKLLVNI